MKLSPDQVSAARRYIEVLPKVLRESYGGAGYSGYTEAQIRVSVDAAGLPDDHCALAVLMFGDEESAAGTGIATTGRDQVMSEIRESIESESPPLIDRALQRFIKFLEKAGDISDGTGNYYY